jgi:hypothetical protein
MATKNPIEDLTKIMFMSAEVLNAAVVNLPEDQKVKFNEELIKQGYENKMADLKNKLSELNNLSSKL